MTTPQLAIGDLVAYESAWQNRIWFGRIENIYAHNGFNPATAKMYGITVDKKTAQIDLLPIWSCQLEYLRPMTTEEKQDYGHLISAAEARAPYSPATIEPPAAPENRIGLRKEEIDWDAHKAFMRDL